MVRIRILDPICISKIAAGEVIERPASVVKELIENAIDASATEIRITTKNGGKDLIEVKDNGVGIPAEDLPLAIKRHSTSKISSEQDLESISTMGFRGEAIYSIASVSRFSITSRTAKDEIATCVTVEGDIDKTQISEGVLATPGTLVRVRDLFFNFIVRRKFLKKPAIEHAFIYNIVAQYAVSHPHISIIFIGDGEIEFQTVKSKNHFHAIKAVFGQELADSLLDVGMVQQGEKLIHGYISKPGYHKRNRKYQNFFLNGRRIFSKILQSSLEEGYGPYLMKREFPVAFLFLELSPKYFDVNIHPQKREVLFLNEPDIMAAVSSTVAHCLKTQEIVPRLSSRDKRDRQKELVVRDTNGTTTSLTKIGLVSADKKQEMSIFSDIKSTELQTTLKDSESPIYEVSTEEYPVKNFFGSDVKFRGLLGEEFILLEDLSNHDLIILDFHAAHERVNLEKLTKLFKANKVRSQTFLKPFRFALTPEQRIILTSTLSYLNNLGFDFRSPKGNKREIDVFAIPDILAKTDLKQFLISLLDTLPAKVIEEQIKQIISLIACHASYRAGEVLSFQQTKNLLQELVETQNPKICAHGRPTYIRIPYSDFLKQVRRV